MVSSNSMSDHVASSTPQLPTHAEAQKILSNAQIADLLTPRKMAALPTDLHELDHPMASKYLPKEAHDPLVYAFGFLGLACSLTWGMCLMAVDDFQRVFHINMEYEFAAVFKFFGFLFGVGLLAASSKIAFKPRILIALGVQSLVTVAIAFLSYRNIADGHYWLMLMAIGGAAQATSHGTICGLCATLNDPRYMRVMMTGVGLSGVAICFDKLLISFFIADLMVAEYVWMLQIAFVYIVGMFVYVQIIDSDKRVQVCGGEGRNRGGNYNAVDHEAETIRLNFDRYSVCSTPRTSVRSLKFQSGDESESTSALVSTIGGPSKSSGSSSGFCSGENSTTNENSGSSTLENSGSLYGNYGTLIHFDEDAFGCDTDSELTDASYLEFANDTPSERGYHNNIEDKVERDRAIFDIPQTNDIVPSALRFDLRRVESVGSRVSSFAEKVQTRMGSEYREMIEPSLEVLRKSYSWVFFLVANFLISCAIFPGMTADIDPSIPAFKKRFHVIMFGAFICADVVGRMCDLRKWFSFGNSNSTNSSTDSNDPNSSTTESTDSEAFADTPDCRKSMGKLTMFRLLFVPIFLLLNKYDATYKLEQQAALNAAVTHGNPAIQHLMKEVEKKKIEHSSAHNSHGKKIKHNIGHTVEEDFVMHFNDHCFGGLFANFFPHTQTYMRDLTSKFGVSNPIAEHVATISDISKNLQNLSKDVSTIASPLEDWRWNTKFTDILALIAVILAGMTNGYVVQVCCCAIPNACGRNEKEQAGNLTFVAYIGGASIGYLVALLMKVNDVVPE